MSEDVRFAKVVQGVRGDDCPWGEEAWLVFGGGERLYNFGSKACADLMADKLNKVATAYHAEQVRELQRLNDQDGDVIEALGERIDFEMRRATAAESALSQAQAEVERMRPALERTLHNFKLLLARKPVRDASETIAEAERALKPEEKK